MYRDQSLKPSRVMALTAGAVGLLALVLASVGVFGVFGAFTFYLPELFPTRLRGTGAGFCYNTGRFVAAAGPFIIGSLAHRQFEVDWQRVARIVSEPESL